VGAAADAGEGTDFHAVGLGFVSVTPLQVDLTNHTRKCPHRRMDRSMMPRYGRSSSHLVAWLAGRAKR
jgi:hypothetical protein